MEKWEIRPTPSADDPDRHVLLLQGGPSDVSALLKKFGALMGRPSPAKAEGFNLSLVLHKLKPAVRSKLDEWLTQAAPPRAAAAVEPPPPVASTVPAPSPGLAPPPPPMPNLAPPPTMRNLAPPPPMPDLAPPPPMPDLAPPPPTMPNLAPPPTMPNLAPPPPMPDLAPPPPAPLPVLAPPPPAAVLPAIPEFKAPEPEKPALVSLTPEPVATPVPVSPPPPPPPPPVLQPAVAEPVAAAAVTSPPASVPPPTGAPGEFPLAVDLRGDWTMDTLLVGAYNRFAHAAAMSVMTSPGTMYNPLFLYGVPGTGKSHMLNAIGGALSKGLGGSVLLSTSGSRLSRAVNAAMARKAIAEIDDRVKNSKALLIDDIHLMAISDQNKDALASVFKSFFDRKLQVVITSLYPPKSLGALEGALKFSFSKGWSVDLKMPSPTIQKDLISSASERNQVGLAGDEITMLHDKLSVWGYSDLTLWLKRVSVFKKSREASSQVATLQEFMRLIYEPLSSGGVEAPKAVASTFKPPVPPANAQPIAVIVPKGPEGLGAYSAEKFYDVGLKNGFTQVYRHALWETYDPAVPFGIPFLIGEMCLRAGVTRALIVGPTPDSPLGPRSAEFAHATRRILESFNVLLAFVPYNGLQLDANYLTAHLDLAAVTPP